MVSERSVKVRLDADVSSFNRALLGASATAKAFTKDLDTSTDRATNLTQSVLALGPALVPLGAAGIPAIAGLTNQLAFAGVAAGTAVLAFHGVGDALKATNEYAIEPTAANFEKMQQSLAKLGPDGREFVGFLQDLRPRLQELQDAAQAGLLPGVEDGLTDLMELLPQAERLVSTVATAMGDLVAEAGDNLNDPRWVEFFEFLDAEARPTLLAMGRSAGNFAEGLANLWMAFAPLSNDFSSAFLDLSRDFATWTDGLDKTEGFQEFIDYIETNGPRVWDTLGSIGNALLQIVEAAAPVGAVALPVISAVADSIAALADSDLGPVAIGLISFTSAYARLIALGKTANSGALGGLLSKGAYAGTLTAAKELPRALLQYDGAAARAQARAGQLAVTTGKLGTSLRGTAKLAGGAAGLGFVMSDLDDKMGLSNTAMLALAGTAFGPWGSAVGAGVGLAMDFAHANDGLWQSVDRANKALADGPQNIDAQGAALEDARKQVEALKSSTDGFGDQFSLKGLKNFTEDAFGKSDVQEADEALARLQGRYEENVAAAQDLKFQQAGLSGAMSGATQATRDQTEALLDNIAAHNKESDRLLAEVDAHAAYEQAIDDAAEGARKNKHTLDDNLPAGRSNLKLLAGLAASYNNLSEDQKNAGGESERAKAKFIKFAEQMSKNREVAESLADQYLHMPESVSTDVSIRDRASDPLRHIREYIEGLHDKSVTIETVYKRTIKGGTGNPNVFGLTKADGGLIGSVRGYDSGGVVSGPGGPRDDLIPAMLSNGEYVVNAAATRANLGLLHAINARRYAGGGFVQQSAPAAPVAMGGSYLAPGARFKLVGPDLIELIDNRAHAAIRGKSRYDKSDSIQMRRPR
jgi:hypothetical protein